MARATRIFQLVGKKSQYAWTQMSAQKAGLDWVKFKFTNHPHQEMTGGQLMNAGVNY